MVNLNSGSIGAICGVLAVFALPGCGSGRRQDAAEPSGKFSVDVTAATFPVSQRLAEHTHLLLRVRNTSGGTIPNIAATICNVTCAYPAPAGEGTSVAAFSYALEQQGLANPSRPVWVVDSSPRGGVTPIRTRGLWAGWRLAPPRPLTGASPRWRPAATSSPGRSPPA
jgi:hypothetical protein